ncbi:MAG: Lytic transglycosylase catalytic, partial [Conexibacter sp.]|nr:Lytic transglycosylase catalytic [Conexibacter sp.]
ASGAAGDPFAYTPARAADLERRAALGTAHGLYAKSPGGILATAARVAALRPLIDAATKGSGVDPADVEGIVLLESAGRADAIAGTRLTSAAGLTQILADTATSLLGMHVDVAGSTRLTRLIARASAAGDKKRVARAVAARMRADARFDPRRALAGTVRYLQTARARFGREDLAVVSYHMGIGNLTNVIAAYGGGRPSYAQLFFDSSPLHHAAAWKLLSGFGDESSLYYWKVRAARSIMGAYRSDRKGLERTAALQAEKASNEDLLHPPGVGAFAAPDALRAAYHDRTIVPLPSNAAALGLRVDPAMGALASGARQPAALYRGLRPDAIALLVAFADRVRAISGTSAPLTITSSVRDTKYQRDLGVTNSEATHAFSVHTTGWTFDFSRRYASRRQAAAVQFVLDRLQALDLIAWVREPAAIHVTVAGDAGRFLKTR